MRVSIIKNTLLRQITATRKYCDFGKIAVLSCRSNLMVYEYNNTTSGKSQYFLTQKFLVTVISCRGISCLDVFNSNQSNVRQLQLVFNKISLSEGIFKINTLSSGIRSVNGVPCCDNKLVRLCPGKITNQPPRIKGLTH